jgi:ubiquinone/menaquinone biosynthesis C-methylase UbiE
MADAKVVFDAADQYERIMGSWSRAAGERFLDWLAPATSLRWLDVGCGTGAFSELVVKRCSPASVTGVDPAPAQIDYARGRMPTSEWRVADAMALPFPESRFDIVSSALVLNFIPNPATGLREMRRVVRDGGIVAGFIWERSATTDFSHHAPMERGLESIGAAVMRPPVTPESSPEGARAALANAGFADASAAAIEATRTFANFDDYWAVQTLLLTPVGKSIAALPPERRELLRETMRSEMKPGSDGSITYSARAVAFRARKSP